MSFKHKKREILVHWKDCKEVIREIIFDPGYVLIGHNIAYDLAVTAAQYPELIPAIFEMYEQGRVRDTMIRQKLLDIAQGIFRGFMAPPSKEDLKQGRKKGKWVALNYSLDDCYYRYTKKRLDKDTWRLEYERLRDLPLSEWPEGAKEYPLKDTDATWVVYWNQEEQAQWWDSEVAKYFTRIENPNVLGDESAQCRAAFWIQLMRVWGIRTRRSRVKKLRDEANQLHDDTLKFLQEQKLCPKCYKLLEDGTCERHGKVSRIERVRCKDKSGRTYLKLVKTEPVSLVRANGVRDTETAKARMAYVMGGEENCRRTKKNQIQLDQDACVASNDPLLKAYSELTQIKSVVTKDIPALMRGILMPIHSNFNSLIATGRTSSSKPNIQNIRRLPGIRECFIPRKGMVFLDADYDGLELRTLAQACIKIVGWSKLAEVLNSGKDPHLMVAAEILDISYEEAVARQNEDAVDEARQTGKVANFGFPGGLGVEALILFAKKTYNVQLTEDRAKRLKRQWIAAFPEMELYFQHINALCAEDPVDGLALVQQLFSGRLRGGIKYTVACNSYFQGLGADATKNAGWLLAKACYVDKKSPLYGCRIVNYIHDQFLIEAPEERAHEACMEMVRLMLEGAKPFLPDVPPTISKPIVARCWSKKAKPVKDKNGRLIPWEFEDAA